MISSIGCSDAEAEAEIEAEPDIDAVKDADITESTLQPVIIPPVTEREAFALAVELALDKEVDTLCDAAILSEIAFEALFEADVLLATDVWLLALLIDAFDFTALEAALTIDLLVDVEATVSERLALFEAVSYAVLAEVLSDLFLES